MLGITSTIGWDDFFFLVFTANGFCRIILRFVYGYCSSMEVAYFFKDVMRRLGVDTGVNPFFSFQHGTNWNTGGWIMIQWCEGL